MNLATYTVRRATVDDLPTLKALWGTMRLPADELEKRLTEFQVAQSADGKLIGAVGFRTSSRQGHLHSEAFTDFGLADEVRPLLWKRIQSLASNHGVFRVWTQERAPFWTRGGFQPADSTALQKLPEPWNCDAAEWLTLQLKDEAAIASLDKEFAMFMESEKQRSARALDQARMLKTIVTLIASIVGLVLIGTALYLYFTRRNEGVLSP